MPVILSLARERTTTWAAGPEGLYRYEQQALIPEPQPQTHPACCAVAGDYLLMGGAPHGVAVRNREESWQASWMDGVEAQVICLAVDPRERVTGVVLAGTEGGGILRTENRGQHWSVCNFGLQEFEVFCLAWASPQPAGAWPPQEIVFAGTGSAIYRSPNGGRGWRRCTAAGAPVLSLAVASDFHNSGAVLAGTEGAGLWRSTDGGHSFAPVPGTPEVVNALVAHPAGWLLSDLDQLWRSADGLTWTPVAGPRPALVLLSTPDGILAGGVDGVELVLEGQDR
ncbi:MAG: hypothetical protein H3C34_12275 [Caldilineaceae bacterium]|nr:hypothetical protein [Caldilineaceae bacterium]